MDIFYIIMLSLVFICLAYASLQKDAKSHTKMIWFASFFQLLGCLFDEQSMIFLAFCFIIYAMIRWAKGD